MNSTVSVVVPTIGRTSLNSALDSIYAQSIQVHQIIVVNTSRTEIDVSSHPALKIISVPGANAASARNAGLGICKSDWIAFLDDDDTWYPKHLENLLAFLNDGKLDAAYSSAFVNKILRPKKVISGVINPLVELYSKNSFFPTQHYLPLPGLIISKRVVAHFPFNEGLNEREDLWFAHKLYEYGFSIGQSLDPSIQVNQDSLRSILRTNAKEDLKWAGRLELVQKNLGQKFLRSIALRNAMIRKDLVGLSKIVRAILVRDY